MQALHCIECKLQRLSIALHPSAPLEPLYTILKQYMDTLCSAQKQTNFTNTLIWDIPIFNGNDSMQLEDWLVDIETAAESGTKLDQAKSKGLPHTSISEALNLDKSWDDIKDTLHLKLCNANIHTSVSCFMEIQQKDKESLATYIPHFMREAKRCNFNNSTATIRIFIKGFRNAQMLAPWVHEKGPQTLADAISEVKKLQAAQQLTATLIPLSTVKIMSHAEDRCFQCQESGHIAWHCPTVCCFECDDYGYIVVDCPHGIPSPGMPAHHYRHKSHNRHCTRSTSHHHHQDRYRHSRSRSQSHPCRYHNHSCHDLYRRHSRLHHRDKTSPQECFTMPSLQ